MFRVFWLFVIAVLCLGVTGCNDNETVGVQTRVFPQDNIFTFITPVDDTVELSVELFDTNEDNGFVKENIEDIYISTEDVSRCPVSVIKTVQHAKMEVDEYSIYRTSIVISINKINCRNMDNATINIKREGDSDYVSFFIGNLVFINNEDNDNIRDALEITDIAPVTYKQDGMLYTVGLVCQLDVADTVTVNEFSMGLTDYGTDSIYILDENYNSIIAKEKGQTLDDLIYNFYDLKVVTDPSDQVRPVEINKGIYTAVIKFEMTEDARIISSIGGVVGYSYRDKDYSCCINCYKVLGAMDYSEDVIRNIIYKEIFTD